MSPAELEQAKTLNLLARKRRREKEEGERKEKDREGHAGGRGGELGGEDKPHLGAGVSGERSPRIQSCVYS